jgi:hypothetical protein
MAYVSRKSDSFAMNVIVPLKIPDSEQLWIRATECKYMYPYT